MVDRSRSYSQRTRIEDACVQPEVTRPRTIRLPPGMKKGFHGLNSAAAGFSVDFAGAGMETGVFCDGEDVSWVLETICRISGSCSDVVGVLGTIFTMAGPGSGVMGVRDTTTEASVLLSGPSPSCSNSTGISLSLSIQLSIWACSEGLQNRSRRKALVDLRHPGHVVRGGGVERATQGHNNEMRILYLHQLRRWRPH